MGELNVLGLEFGTDKVGHHYCFYYERHLDSLRRTPMRLLEIGVLAGASLRMWEAYFPLGQITGVDIAPEIVYITDRVTTVTCDVKDFTPSGLYDVVIDDGSHQWPDIIEAHTRLWPAVVPGGWYVIEDLDVQQHGLPVFGLIAYTVEALAHELGDVGELHVYNQIAFLRKRP
jgi:trans-aconitate methyltransferase